MTSQNQTDTNAAVMHAHQRWIDAGRPAYMQYVPLTTIIVHVTYESRMRMMLHRAAAQYQKKIIYGNCSRVANDQIELAFCVVNRLRDIKDRFHEHQTGWKRSE